MQKQSEAVTQDQEQMEGEQFHTFNDNQAQREQAEMDYSQQQMEVELGNQEDLKSFKVVFELFDKKKEGYILLQDLFFIASSMNCDEN